jgi:hypothetical protein
VTVGVGQPTVDTRQAGEGRTRHDLPGLDLEDITFRFA